jgi:hypothetical protein
MKNIRMILFVEDQQPRSVEVNSQLTVGEFLKKHVPQTAGRPDYEEDYEVYVLDDKGELSKDKTFDKLKVKDDDALIVHRCKKVSVKVEYAGHSFIHEYAPALKFEHVLKKTLDHFDIKGKERGDFQLFLTKDLSKVVNLDYPVGAYSKYGECKVEVYLSKPIANQG